MNLRKPFFTGIPKGHQESSNGLFIPVSMKDIEH